MNSTLTRYVFPITACVAAITVLLLFLVGPLTAQTNLPAVVASMTSTFLGASFAFQLNSLNEVRKRYEDRVASIYLAQFIVSQQQFALEDIWNRIKQWEGKSDRGLNMPKMQVADFSQLRQDRSALSFIIENDPNLLLELFNEDARFAQSILSVKAYADFYEDFILAMYRTSSGDALPYTAEIVKEKLGNNIYSSATNLADVTLKNVSLTRISLAEINLKLHSYGKKYFPKEKFYKITVDGD